MVSCRDPDVISNNFTLNFVLGKHKNILLLSVAWERIILDEAHQIRNPRSQTSLAVCRIKAARRWAVTGTPIQNKELDMYSLIRFLRVSPFDEYRVWKVWVDNKTATGQKRMNTMVKCLLLRRTKEQKSLVTNKAIVELPNKSVVEHKISLNEKERQVYDEVFSFSQQAMINYMKKHDEESEDNAYMDYVSKHGTGKGYKFNSDGGAEVETQKPAAAIGKMVQNEDIKAHHILVLLLRLRQVHNLIL